MSYPGQKSSVTFLQAADTLRREREAFPSFEQSWTDPNNENHTRLGIKSTSKQLILALQEHLGVDIPVGSFAAVWDVYERVTRPVRGRGVVRR